MNKAHESSEWKYKKHPKAQTNADGSSVLGAQLVASRSVTMNANTVAQKGELGTDPDGHKPKGSKNWQNFSQNF